MPPLLHTRQREAEWMDAPNVDPKDLRHSLTFIRKINALLGYTRVTLSCFKQFSRLWNSKETITILDVATGSADIPRAILNWSQKHHFNIHLTGIDQHPDTIRIAKEQTPHLETIRGDARALPFADKSFDYVITAMFIHHLDEADVVLVLKEMNRVARRGIIVADLLRNRRAYAWITFFTLLASKIVSHDARASVAQAFTRTEILDLCRQAGLVNPIYRRHFGHRFVILANPSR